jgi:hypothetical protein
VHIPCGIERIAEGSPAHEPLRRERPSRRDEIDWGRILGFGGSSWRMGGATRTPSGRVTRFPRRPRPSTRRDPEGAMRPQWLPPPWRSRDWNATFSSRPQLEDWLFHVLLPLTTYGTSWTPSRPRGPTLSVFGRPMRHLVRRSSPASGAVDGGGARPPEPGT